MKRLAFLVLLVVALLVFILERMEVPITPAHLAAATSTSAPIPKIWDFTRGRTIDVVGWRASPRELSTILGSCPELTLVLPGRSPATYHNVVPVIYRDGNDVAVVALHFPRESIDAAKARVEAMMAEWQIDESKSLETLEHWYQRVKGADLMRLSTGANWDGAGSSRSEYPKIAAYIRWGFRDTDPWSVSLVAQLAERVPTTSRATSRSVELP